MADQEFKIDTGNKIMMILSVLALLAVVVFLLTHLANFLGQLALGDRDPVPAATETVDQRIAPVGRVEVAAVDLDAAPAAPKAPADVYQSACAACHSIGAAGAPRSDDGDEWERRLSEKGLDTLVLHSINGFQGMPARGGNPNLSDEEVTGAVKYMLTEAGLDVDATAVAAADPPAAVEPEPAAVPEIAGDVDAGRDRYAACVSCHGAEGEGMGIFPKISGQSAAYIADKLKAYRAGETVGPNTALMAPMAMPLSDEAIADLAVFVATLGMPEELAPEPEAEQAGPAGNAEAGAGLYGACASCHGPQGQGMGTFPKISGQSADYVADKLRAYRAGEMVGPQSPLMIPQALGLSDQAIADLAAYIASF